MKKNKLTNLEVASLKPRSTHYQVSDGGGLSLKVYPNGRKQWLLRKTSQGKATSTPLGDYPAVSIAAARAKAAELSASFVDGRKVVEDKPVLFKDIKEQWLASKTIRASSLKRIRAWLAPLVVFDSRLLSDITASQARAAVEHYIKTGHIPAAKGALMCLSQIERYGLALGLTDSARLQYVSRTLPKTTPVHRRFVEADKLPLIFELLNGDIKYGTDKPDLIKVLCLTLCRANEVTALRYEWIDFDNKVITIPASQMKAKREHRIPICSQLEAILKRRQSLGGVFVFPSNTKSGHLASIIHFNRLPIHELICPHGFRSMGRSWMAANGYDFAASEYCLAHRAENATQAAYQRTDYLEQRRKIMQDWGDYVEQCYLPYFPD